MATGAEKILRARLAEAQNHRCCYCGCRFGRGLSQLTLEHYQARCHGGRSTYENCIAACRLCNQRRGHQHPMKFWFFVVDQARRIVASEGTRKVP